MLWTVLDITLMGLWLHLGPQTGWQNRGPALKGCLRPHGPELSHGLSTASERRVIACGAAAPPQLFKESLCRNSRPDLMRCPDILTGNQTCIVSCDYQIGNRSAARASP